MLEAPLADFALFATELAQYRQILENLQLQRQQPDPQRASVQLMETLEQRGLVHGQ